MKLIKGLLKYSVSWNLPDIYLFTGNGTIKNNGAIVMGRGAALQVRDAYPGIDKEFGRMLTNERTADIYDPRIMFVKRGKDQYLGWFKVKHHWADQADLDLITTSTRELQMYALAHADKKFHMNFPGVGNGGLDIDQVMPIIEPLPDNVFIYR